MLTDLRLHTAGVNVVEFHPNELLLSSGSSDRYVVQHLLNKVLCQYECVLCPPPDMGRITLKSNALN